MFMTVKKLQVRTLELERRRYAPAADLFPMSIADAGVGGDNLHNDYPGKIDGKPLARDDYFIGWDAYAWVQKTARIPERREGFSLWGLFNFGQTGGGFNRGFESLLFLNGKRFQAVDTYHYDVPLDALAGQDAEFTFMLWTGLNGGSSHAEHHHRFSRAELCWLHGASDELYRYARGICEALEVLPETDTNRDDLLKALDAAYKLVNWDADTLFDTAAEALACLKKRLAKLNKHSDITVYCAGHTHIDIAWLWRLKHTHEKTVRSFTTADRLMEEFDDFVFLQSQPQLLSFIKKDAPELYEKVKARVKSKQWEPDGAMWLEADCNVTSGESLARQLLHGCLFLRSEFGRESEYLWLPDVFGYSWALPQILKLANIKTFMTTKISWNQYDKMPHDVFKWRGVDGSEVLTYFVTTPSPGRPHDEYRTTYNGMITAETVAGAWRKFSDKDLSRDVLISYGYGDGGGGVTREMIHNAHVLDELPGLPNVKLAGGVEFFRKLHANIAAAESHVPTWDGELYLEFHRGTYTTQARNKKWNRTLETRLATSEWLDATAARLGGADHHDAFHESWECVLLHQFHDIIPGSSVQEVYEDSRVNYGVAAGRLDRVEREQSAILADGAADSYSIWNFSSFDRADAVLLPETREGSFVDGNGKTLQSQATGDGTWVRPGLAPLGGGTVRFVPGAKAVAAGGAAAPFAYDAGARSLTTPYYTLRWNNAGRLISVFDKTAGRETLAGEGNALELYEDKPLGHDAWDIDMFYVEKMERIDACGSPELIANGQIMAALRFKYATRNSVSAITQDVVVYAASRRIDFVTNVDWHEDHRLLKAAFPLDIRSTKARYDIQYGYVERPTHWNTSWDQARFEVAGHKWADMSEHGFGAALMNDCKYGYSAYGNTLRISLLKSSKEPDAIADMGEHSFTYSFMPHGDELLTVIAEATALNIPYRVAAGKQKDARRLLRLDGVGVQVDAFKRAEDGDGYVLRVHEVLGGRGKATVTSEFGIKKSAACNLLEDITGEKTEAAALDIRLRPFEIQNFRVWF